MWRAAWIESATDLRQAYDAVLAVEDAERRAGLIAQLADLPVKRHDVMAIRAEVKRIEEEDEAAVPSFMAETSSDLAARFRSHYRDVRDRARS